ncbi:MAG: alpha/beta fold hydrolase [Methanotrichaceae archaeon]
MGYINVGNIRIYYEIHGQGEPLLLIMGLGGHILDWGWILPQELAKHYQIIMFDNRGSGRTDQPQGPYSIKQMANDTVGLMNSIGLNRASIFGVSMGSMIAQEIAVNYSEKVSNLVLGCSRADGDKQIKPAPEIEAYLSPRTDLTLQGALWWSAPAGYPPEFIYSHPEIIERKIQANMAYPCQLHAYEAQLAAFKAYDSHSRISSIKAPTLIITGQKDVLIPPENSLILSRQIPNARLLEINGAGHLFWISHANETLSALISFLG